LHSFTNMASKRMASDGLSRGHKHDMASAGSQPACDVAVGAAALTELERRMYENSIGIRASPSITQLLQQLGCSAASTQSEMDVATGQTCSWISEMLSVEETVENALCEEGSDDVTRLETKHSSGDDAMDARLAQLQHAVRLQIVAPMFKAYGFAQEQAGSRLMLTAFSYDVLALLAKTWQLAQVRGLQVQRLKSSIASLQTEIKAKKMKIESKEKPMLKEKSWELARAQARIEQLEGDLKKSGQQFLQLERAKQRETSCREECERRLCSLQFDNHRQLSSSKAVLEQAKEALTDAREEVQRLGELETAFKNCRGQSEKLERQQQSCGGAVSNKVQSVDASSEVFTSSLQTCPRIQSGAASTSLGETPQIGMSSSHASLSLVQRRASTLLCNRGSAGSVYISPRVSTIRAPANKEGPNKVLPVSAVPSTATANHRSHACGGQLIDCKPSRGCQRHHRESLPTADSRRLSRWPPA